MKRGAKHIHFTNGESVVFDEYFRSNFQKFVAFTSRFLIDTQQGEDVVQDTFVQIWRTGGDYGHHGNGVLPYG